MKTNSIASRVIFYFISTAIFMSLVTIGVLYLYVTKSERRNLEIKAEDTIASLTGSLAIPIYTLDDNLVTVIGETYAREPSVVQIEVIDYSREKSVYYHCCPVNFFRNAITI